MASINFTTSNSTNLSNNLGAAIIGKNGFTGYAGELKLLVNSYSVVDESVSSNGNVEFSISTLDNCFDDNFYKHILAVNDGFFSGLKGFDYISVPVVEKSNAEELEGFVGYNPIITDYSANVLSYNTTGNNVKIENIHSGTKKLSDLLANPPFYISLYQIIDARYFANNSMYISGTSRDIEVNYNLESNVTGGTFTANIKSLPKYKDAISLYVDGIKEHPSHFTFTVDNYNIMLNDLTGDEKTLRIVVKEYTVPAIEIGDNISFISENVYAVANTSYSPESPTYNVALTANNIYKIQLASNLSSNVAGFKFTNITQDIFGTLGNVYANGFFSIDYNSSTYPGNWSLANNRIYKVEAPLNFTPIVLPLNNTIENVPLGTNIIRARNVNTQGRKSPYVTKSAYVTAIPIQKVSDLVITESLYKDTAQGILVRAIVSFTHITAQDVTDYEVSYKLGGEASDVTSYTTVKISSDGVDTDGKIRFIINNLDRGRTSAVNSIIVRVTPLNRTIRGIESVKEQEILGKLASPQEILNLVGGQQGQNLVFSWKVPKNADGSVVDIDLNETVIRRISGTIIPSEYSNNWLLAKDYRTVATPATSIITNIEEYGTHTYLFKTKDTSKIESDNAVGITLTTYTPPNLSVYKVWREDDPTTDVYSFVQNENNTEYYYPSFANSATGGLSEPGASSVDNANGTSSGFSAIGGAPTDILATSNSYYISQVRDVGNIVTGIIQVTLNSYATITHTFNSLHGTILSGVTDASTAANVLIDTSFGGIGTILGYSNANAATVTYGPNNKTLISGGAAGNVFAIWNPGQFTDDTSNSNSFALIAGVINANAIALGNVYSGNGIDLGTNNFDNITSASTSYELVNLNQFIDPEGDLTFLGQDDLITENVQIRYSISNVYYANGNVNSSAWTSTSENNGWVSYSSIDQSFRWFQVRADYNNNNPNQVYNVLDKFYYTIDLINKTFTDTVLVDSSPTTVEFDSIDYLLPPEVNLSTYGDGPYLPVITDVNKNNCNIKVYNTNTGTAITGVNVFVMAEGI